MASPEMNSGLRNTIALLGPAPPDRGGIAHQTSLLARHLGDTLAGYFTYSREYPRLLNPRRFDRARGVDSKSSGAVAALDWSRPLSWRMTAREILSTGAGALIAPWWTAFWALPLRSVFAGTRSSDRKFRNVLLCHHLFDHESSSLTRWLAWRTFGSADAIVAQSEDDGRALTERFPKMPVEVIAHAVERRPRPDREASRSKLGIGSPLVLFLGLIRPYKGVEVLIDAAPLIVAATGARIAIVGEVFPGSRKDVERLRSSPALGSIDLIDRYVAESEMDEWLAACDVVVCPYRRNAGSGIAARAISALRPIVASDLPGFHPFVNSSTGELVPEGNPELLARAVIRVLCRGFGVYEKALDEAARYHGWESYSRKVAEFVGSLD
jgi:glycosyltransferase involved in cell wall biosynthesis